MLKCLIISPFCITGCTNIAVNLKKSQLTENIENEIINKVNISYNKKELLNIKANSHKDPNLKGDLIRQEYFINFDF